MAVRVILSQAGLATLLLAWALLGAWAFRQTEGPHERRRVDSVREQQYALSEELAEAARQLAEAGVGVCSKAAARAAASLAVTTREADGGGGGSGGGSEDDGGSGSGGGSGESEAAAQAWRTAAASYVDRHEALLLEAVDDGFGEGGGGSIWTFAGCLLFAVSLLTTLGFGAPVPRTTAGRISAAVFAAVGIPLHLLLALNAGALAASRLTRLALWLQRRRRTQRTDECATCVSPPPPQPTDGWSPPGSCPCSSWRGARWPAAAAAAAAACTACGDACAAGVVACAAAAAWPCARRRDECAPAPGPQPVRQSLHAPAVMPMDGGDKAAVAAAFAVDMEANSHKAPASSPDPEAAPDEDAPPGWLHWAPTVAAVVYYVIGVLAFGASRSRPAAACLLFPLDFTATGGVGRVDGTLRALYAIYLEGAVLLAATGVAIHRVAAARGLEALGMRWGLLTNDETF